MSHSQICYEELSLKHAWLNLWDKHMTTGRINQVFTLMSTPESTSQTERVQMESDYTETDRGTLHSRIGGEKQETGKANKFKVPSQLHFWSPPEGGVRNSTRSQSRHPAHRSSTADSDRKLWRMSHSPKAVFPKSADFPLIAHRQSGADQSGRPEAPAPGPTTGGRPGLEASRQLA